VYGQDQEEYDIEEGEGDGMMYEGDLPHPEFQHQHRGAGGSILSALLQDDWQFGKPHDNS